MALETNKGKSWQETLSGSKEKLNALFHDGYISDLTITFKGKEIEYKAHKVILAMASSVFEKMLFGPMAITGSMLKLSDDPKAFKIVLAHCYEVNIEPSDLDEALTIYLMADKYFLDELTRKCSTYISKTLSSENINKVVEFSVKYNFDSLLKDCWHPMMCSSEILLALCEEQGRALLETDGLKFFSLMFTDSWQCPKEILPESTIIQILSSQICTIEGLRTFSGCVSAEVVRNISWASHSVMYEGEPHDLRISFINIQQANSIIRVIHELKFTGWLRIHLQCHVIQPEMLEKLPILEGPFLYISDVDDNGINYVISTIKTLMNGEEAFDSIYFPKSNLTLSGFKTLLRKIAIIVKDFNFPDISIYSPNVPSSKNKELERWIYFNFLEQDEGMFLQVHDKQEEMDGWELS